MPPRKHDPQRAAAMTRESIRYAIAEAAKRYKSAHIAFESEAGATHYAILAGDRTENDLLDAEDEARDSLFDLLAELEKAEASVPGT